MQYGSRGVRLIYCLVAVGSLGLDSILRYIMHIVTGIGGTLESYYIDSSVFKEKS